MTRFGPRASFIFAGIAALNALLFAAGHDWQTAGIALATGAIFVWFGVRKLRKRNA